MLGLNRRNFMDDSQLESIHNYYEHLVFNQIATVSERAQEDTHFFADVACVALNQLPAKYVRHDVDMSFYMTAEEINQKNVPHYVSNKHHSRCTTDRARQKFLSIHCIPPI